MSRDTLHAFPTAGGAYGMTLRDYFAAVALPGIIQACGGDTMHGAAPEQYFAQKAYAVADAMLAQRG